MEPKSQAEQAEQMEQVARALFVHVQESAERLRSALDEAYAIACNNAEHNEGELAAYAVETNLLQLQASSAQDEALFRAFLSGHVQAQTKALEAIAHYLQMLVDK